MVCKVCKKNYTDNTYGDVCSEKCETQKIWINYIPEVNNEPIDKYFVCDDELLLMIDEKQDTLIRGTDGKRFYFDIGNGKVLTTTNLWHIGTIPSNLRQYFVKNTKKINKLKGNEELYIYTGKKLKKYIK